MSALSNTILMPPQCNLGPIGLGRDKAEPPRFVFLDDRAVYEVFTSDIQRARLNHSWPHDFSANGRVRARRTHCGRPAIRNHATSEVHSAPVTKTTNYYFTGEKDYRPVVYRIPPLPRPEPTVEALIRKRKAEDAADPTLYNPRAHGHNQWTPKDMMVKHGAPTFSRKNSGENNLDSLASLKSQAPGMGIEKRLYTEGTGRQGISRPGSARSAGSESVASHPSKDVFPLPDVTNSLFEATGEQIESVTNGAVPAFKASGQGSEDSLQNHNEVDKSDLDEEPFRKFAASPHPRIRKSFVTAVAALEAPQQIGYVDRHVHEKAPASDISKTAQNQDDVVRISGELAEANVAIVDQAREIEKLRKALDDSQSLIQSIAGGMEGEKKHGMSGLHGGSDDVTM